MKKEAKKEQKWLCSVMHAHTNTHQTPPILPQSVATHSAHTEDDRVMGEWVGANRELKKEEEISAR